MDLENGNETDIGEEKRENSQNIDETRGKFNLFFKRLLQYL